MKRAFVTAVILAAACGAACHKQEVIGSRSPVMVTVQSVGTYTATEGTRRFSASIVPESQVSVAFKVGGYVEEILRIGGHLAQEGDFVSRGQVLARVRQSDYQVKVRQAQAQVAAAAKTIQTARAQLDQALAAQDKARSDFRRAEALYATKSLIRPDFDAAKAQLDGTTAQVAAARSQVETAEQNLFAAEAQEAEAKIALGDSTLAAPVSGLILKRNVEIGYLAAIGTPAFEMADIGTVKAVFGVPDTELPKVKLGMELSLQVEVLPGEGITGKVTAISPAADPKTRVFSVEVTIVNRKQQLKPGMIVSVSLLGDEAQAETVAVIPLASVIRSKEDPGKYAVAILDGASDQGTVRFRTIRLGDIYGNQVAVLDGVKPGERVVVSGAQQIMDGQKVQVMQ